MALTGKKQRAALYVLRLQHHRLVRDHYRRYLSLRHDGLGFVDDNHDLLPVVDGLQRALRDLYSRL